MAKKNEIAKAESASLQPLENIENLIHVIRGKQVMLDRDLARLYGVETRVLNQAVQRNIERFPKDFMFQLSKEDVEFLKSQNVILETGTNMSSQNVTTSDEFLRSQIVTLEKVDMRGKHVKFLPYAFTENGVAMLSGVLRSPQAININIQIMRAFTTMRHFIASNAQVFQRLEVIEHTQLSLVAHKEDTDKKFEEVFRRLDEGAVTPKEAVPTPPIIAETIQWLDDYFAGKRPCNVPRLDPQGTAFQKRVWQALFTIPYGETVSYGELARMVGCRSARAVGQAVGTNHVALLIPCHRVIAAHGKIGGYKYGIEIKKRLLEVENILQRRP